MLIESKYFSHYFLCLSLICPVSGHNIQTSVGELNTEAYNDLVETCPYKNKTRTKDFAIPTKVVLILLYPDSIDDRGQIEWDRYHKFNHQLSFSCKSLLQKKNRQHRKMSGIDFAKEDKF
jgi:hypothetical protein